jgi:hypothetical protein
VTVHKDFKRLVRERAQRTGESYAAARRSLLAKSQPPAAAPAGAAAVVHDLWFTRGTKGYSGKPAKPTGFEHHRVTVDAGSGRMSVVADVSFTNYGEHRFTVTAHEEGCTSHFDYDTDAARIVVDARWTGDAWHGEVDGDGGADAFALPPPVGMAGALPVPSVVGRFLPIRLPRERGELAAYTPLPEDGFPAWRPRRPKSWFPLMGVSRTPLVVPRMVVGQGEETVSLGGRRKVEAFRYDHVAAETGPGESTWVDADGRVVRYEQRGLVLVATSPPAGA